MFTFLAAKWLLMKCMQCASMLIVWPCSHVQSHAYSFYIYIYMSLYVCLWSKNIYTTGNWIRSLFFCCCCKSASIKLCQSWKMPAGEVRKNPNLIKYIWVVDFLLICLKTNWGMDAAHGFWKSKQWACYIILYFFLLGVQPCLTVSSYSLQKMERVQWPPWSMLCNIGCLLPLLPQLDLTRHLPLWHKRWRANAQLCHQTGSKISSKLHAQPEGEKLDDGWPESE